MRSGTAPAHRMDGTVPRLAGWLTLVGLMIAIAYLGRATEGKPDPKILYHWSTAVGGIIQDGIILLIVLALAGFNRDLLALRRPRSIRGRSACSGSRSSRSTSSRFSTAVSRTPATSRA